MNFKESEREIKREAREHFLVPVLAAISVRKLVFLEQWR